MSDYTIATKSLANLGVTASLSAPNMQASVLSLTLSMDPGEAPPSELAENSAIMLKNPSGDPIFSGTVPPYEFSVSGVAEKVTVKIKGGFYHLLQIPLVVDGRAIVTVPAGTPASQLTWLWNNSDITLPFTLSATLPTGHNVSEMELSNTTVGAAVQGIVGQVETASSLIDYSTTPPTFKVSHLAATSLPTYDLLSEANSSWSNDARTCASVHINFVRSLTRENIWTDQYGVEHSSPDSSLYLVSTDAYPTTASPAASSVVADLQVGGTRAIRNISSVYNFTNGGTPGYQTLGHLSDKYYFGPYYAHVGVLKAVKAMNFESKTGLELEEFGIIDDDYKGYGLADGNYWYPIISSIKVEELYNPSGITYAEDDLFWLREVPVVGSYYASDQVNLITEELKEVEGVVFCRADITVKWWTGVPTISPNTNISTTWSVDCIYKAVWNGSAWVAAWTAGSSYAHSRRLVEEQDYETPPTGLAQQLHTQYNQDRWKATYNDWSEAAPSQPIASLKTDSTTLGPALLQNVSHNLATDLRTLTFGAATQLAPQDLLTRIQALNK